MTNDDDDRRSTVRFGGLIVPVDDHVLTPREWTLAQSDWAVTILGECGPGPILELFAGSGHIGAEVGRRTARPVVLVDASPAACRLAAITLALNGVDAEIRQSSVSEEEVERAGPALILADPPYVPSHAVGDFPTDPVDAIDGGRDGLEPTRAALLATHTTVRVGVPLLLQLRGEGQAAAIDDWMKAHRLHMRIDEVRYVAHDRALVLITSGT